VHAFSLSSAEMARLIKASYKAFVANSRFELVLNYESEPGILFILDLGNDFTLGGR